MPKRIQRRRIKGWRMPPNCIYVGRGSKWGNPFKIGIDGTREKCVERYRLLIEGNIWTFPNKTEIQRVLKGKDLCCFCPLDKPCHADILLKYANET